MVELMTARALIDALDLMGWSIAFNEKGEQAGMNETHVVATKGIRKIEAIDRWALGYEPDRLHVLQSIYDVADAHGEYLGIPIRAVDELTPEPGVTYRWDVAWGQYTIGGSRLNRWRLKWRMFRYRARDAWGVLTGKIEVE